MNSELSEEFKVKAGMHQGSMLSPFLFAVVVDSRLAPNVSSGCSIPASQS